MHARIDTHWLWICLSVFCAMACGGKSAVVDDSFEPAPRPQPQPEVCNGLDDDLDGLLATRPWQPDASTDASMDASMDASVDSGVDASVDVDLHVDEDFRDEQGRYITDAHCGACDRPCTPTGERVLESGCRLVEESPTCVALRCEQGFVPSRTGRCVPVYDRLCFTCADDGDCGDFPDAQCAEIAGERRCTVACVQECPAGYRCGDDGIGCVPESGSCQCEVGDSFDLACVLRDPMGQRCPGTARCEDGVLSTCAAPEDVCDEVDNDCDGVVDEAYRDSRGAYIVDIRHCGECGVDCTVSTAPEGDLICGGDPFAPSCVLNCPDAADGISPGDRIDADLDIATGCECRVSSLVDEPGPVLAEGELLDVNCDGADGVVLESFYVAPDGDDTGPGSPTRPLRTLSEAMSRVDESMMTGSARLHVFVASGVYTETLRPASGALIHGGYRRDFLALDPNGFRVEVRAPSETTAPGGAALEIRDVSGAPTLLQWMEFRGVDASAASSATFGAYVFDPDASLSLLDLTIRAGVPGDGAPGVPGTAGESFVTLPSVGEPPRGASEDRAHQCLPGMVNVVAGGEGGTNRCDAVSTNGGNGGAPACPVFASFQPSGTDGQNALGVSGGRGGAGGQDSEGPLTGRSCSEPVCCGLADFTVPTDFQGPQPGSPGRNGRAGLGGMGCVDAFGRFEDDRWAGETATTGTDGTPGSGGGGGGAGGGAAMQWFDGVCEFADGLGGGGGGGGAGGCGGSSGTAGTSGAPSIAMVVRYPAGTSPASLANIRNVTFVPADGGRGGDGGAGGIGGTGASGAFGGTLMLEERTTPTTAQSFSGGRGGPGGDGGSGGGGGGGCGGASVGIWVHGLGGVDPGTSAWSGANTFRLGQAGRLGEGGGGAAPGRNGQAGGTFNVLVR